MAQVVVGAFRYSSPEAESLAWPLIRCTAPPITKTAAVRDHSLSLSCVLSFLFKASKANSILEPAMTSWLAPACMDVSAIGKRGRDLEDWGG